VGRSSLSRGEGVIDDQVSIVELTAARQANKRIRDLARKVGAHEHSVWEFVCECGQPFCEERINVTLSLYDEARHVRASVLAHGHVRARARAARNWSSEVRAEASAVRSQAEQQIRRAERLRSTRRDYRLVVEGNVRSAE
jgi:hypothetical protein